jgi:hypothetical protein
MDCARFDGLIRRFGQSRSRRQTLRGLAGAVVVGTLALGEREIGADTCKGNGKPCKKNRQCCSNNCVGASGGTTNDGTCQPACLGAGESMPVECSLGTAHLCCNQCCNFAAADSRCCE